MISSILIAVREPDNVEAALAAQCLINRNFLKPAIPIEII
jgi:hypothetical protein